MSAVAISVVCVSPARPGMHILFLAQQGRQPSVGSLLLPDTFALLGS
jgi:hypothetical protein